MTGVVNIIQNVGKLRLRGGCLIECLGEIWSLGMQLFLGMHIMGLQREHWSLFFMMQREGKRPNSITLVSVFEVLC